MSKHLPIPADHEVQPVELDPANRNLATCGTCELTWDDLISTSMTPAPSARCPFEPFHVYDDEPTRTAFYECRDFGYDVETGKVQLPPLEEYDWTGKRPYLTTDGETVYLFDDELAFDCPHGCPLVIHLDEIDYHEEWHRTSH